MTISLCIKGMEEMIENIIIKPSVQKRFDSFIAHGRVLFFQRALRLWKDRAGGRAAARAECAAAKRGRPRLRDSTVSAGLGHSAD